VDDDLFAGMDWWKSHVLPVVRRTFSYGKWANGHEPYIHLGRQVIQMPQKDPDEGLVVSAPEANAYGFQSGGVIEVLEKLLDKSIAERTTWEKEEMNSKHAHDMLMQDLKAQIVQATQDRDEKSEFKAETLPSKADAKGDLEATCKQKASDFEARQGLRAEAIGKAIEIISSGAVSGNADKHLPGLLQRPALVQLRAQLTSANLPRIASYHPERARTLGSCVLSALAVRVESDLFAKVEKMIKDFIVKLMEEVNEEAEHKGWCDTEFSTKEHDVRGRSSSRTLLHSEAACPAVAAFKRAAEICTWRQCGLATY